MVSLFYLLDPNNNLHIEQWNWTSQHCLTVDSSHQLQRSYFLLHDLSTLNYIALRIDDVQLRCSACNC